MESNTPLKQSFFSSQNIDRLQHLMQRRFQAESGMVIDRQSDQELEVIMGTVWAHNAQGGMADLSILNNIVLEETLEQIRAGVAHHLNWDRLRDQPQLITPGVSARSWNPLIVDKKIF